MKNRKVVENFMDEIKTEKEEFFLLQMFSSAYQNWVSEENDIYDELFSEAS
jgi:hypothetical protein